jgi:hypothetical protein
MNRSYSKIRHIQNINLILESRFVTEQQGVSNQSQVNTATNAQTQRGQPITSPNNINVNTIFITPKDRSGSSTTADVSNENMFCKVTEIKDNVMIRNKKYKMVKAFKTDTTTPSQYTTTPSQCGIANFNEQPGWIVFDYETNKNSTIGHFLEPNTEYPQGFLSQYQTAFRDNSNSIFTVQQSNTSAVVGTTVQNTTQSNTVPQNTNTTSNTTTNTAAPQNTNTTTGTSTEKINKTNDKSFDYMLKDGKYYFKGKGSYAAQYPQWKEATGTGLSRIKQIVKFQ